MTPEFKVNQKIWHIEISNAVEEKSYRKNGIKISEHKIIGISKYKICINNDWFTTIDFPEEKNKRKDDYKTYFDVVITSIRTGNNILGDGIFIYLYSTKKPTKAILNKMGANAALTIDKDYGFLFNGAKEKIYDFIDNYEIK